MRYVLAAALLLASPRAVGAAQEEAATGGAPYRSPYGVNLPFPAKELIPDLLDGERGDPRFEAKVPHADWYRHEKPRIGPWGPLPRAYEPPAFARGRSDDWKRARLLATALRFVGYGYRHHYIPDWDPPPGWYTPKPGGTRHDGKGVDCSNFTSFVLSQALGIGISSDVHKQAATETASIHGSDETFGVKIIPRQETVEGWKQVLRPGDLLFVRPRSGEGISHVVFWVGDWGTPAETSLVLDSHGADVRDSSGAMIPSGIQLRPFRPGSWYLASADHALRIIGP